MSWWIWLFPTSRQQMIQLVSCLFSSTWLCQQSAWNRNLSVIHSLSVSQIFLYLTCGFLSNFSCSSPGPSARTFFSWIFEKKKKKLSMFYTFFPLFFKIAPYGRTISKHYYKSHPKGRTSPEFSSQWSLTNYIQDFWNYKFPIFNDFFFNFKFTIVLCGKTKSQFSRKMRDHRVKWSLIWNSQAVIVHIWGTFGLVALKVILGSFSALAIFAKITSSKWCLWCFFYT